MLRLLLFIACLVSAKSASGLQPSICGLYNCLQYKVTDTLDDVEVRCYQQSKWASTSVEGTSLKNGMREGSRHLLEYRKGRNRKEAEFDVTLPNLLHIPSCRSVVCPKNYTSSVILPSAFKESHPGPIDGTIVVTFQPKFCAFVKSFSGNITEVNVREQARLLRLSLAQRGLFDFQYDYFYLARYYLLPKKAFHPNEIWLIMR